MTVENDRDNHPLADVAGVRSTILPSLSPQRRFALVGWAVMMVLIAALSIWPEGVVSDRHHLDKVGHFAAYAALAFLPTLFASSLRQALAIATGVCLIGLSLEAAQFLLPGRVPSLLDATANLAGAIVGTGAGFVARPFLKQVLREISA
ncbi:MAG: hypothetical protein CMI60_11980 [Parvibaculum sp.]|jgi:VanZ family protein|nr:hypothetical protein [Parvibaculum sp.]|tara:strand:+ start:1241 stop:1687 length:447 start_codon:yes stop_codon:yes gene_type:complete